MDRELILGIIGPIIWSVGTLTAILALYLNYKQYAYDKNAELSASMEKAGDLWGGRYVIQCILHRSGGATISLEGVRYRLKSSSKVLWEDDAEVGVEADWPAKAKTANLPIQIEKGQTLRIFASVFMLDYRKHPTMNFSEKPSEVELEIGYRVEGKSKSVSLTHQLN